MAKEETLGVTYDIHACMVASDDSVEEIVKSYKRGKGEEKETYCYGIVGDAVEHVYGSWELELHWNWWNARLLTGLLSEAAYWTPVICNLHSQWTVKGMRPFVRSSIQPNPEQIWVSMCPILWLGSL